ncbi:hypothetical protein [Pseudomonas sp.]|uniref:hypothetical protein n=1 Tax=Pseudomonas sp. TaxID=306 RepID=UPI0024889173|nr:hypothetical protein [Pseudomonas sp.]MDI1330887.1 hypothetical protein [Pseudomonas sp.]
MAAKGSNTGRTYQESEILDNNAYPAMRAETLLNEDDELVIPVRNKERPHFRRIGALSFGTRVGQSEADPAHNQCVDEILGKLTATNGVELCVYVFDENSVRHTQVIFSTLTGSNYRWVKEGDARVSFSDGRYIQPDIAGRDANKFFPRSSCPNIIIEVIRTHEPDLETFKRLYELSKASTIVVFYFINENTWKTKLNHVLLDANPFRLRISRYMINGSVYVGDTESYVRRRDEELDNWHLRLANSYFKLAKEAVKV